MKKEILVFIFDGYADWECAYICSELNKLEDKYVVKTIGVDREPKKSMGGFTVIPDYSIDECPSDFEMILLIGGEAWEQKKNNSIKSIFEKIGFSGTKSSTKLDNDFVEVTTNDFASRKISKAFLLDTLKEENINNHISISYFRSI